MKERRTKKSLIKLTNILEPFVDNWNMIGNLYGDGTIEVGDASQRTGTAYAFENWTNTYVLWWRNDKSIADDLLNPPRRHLDKSRWPGKKNSLSRDNAITMIISNKYYAKKIFKKLLIHCSLFWNYNDLEGKKKKIPMPDLAGPIVYGSIFRTCNWWYLYPLICLFDCFLLVSSIWTVLYNKIKPSHTSDMLNAELLVIHGWKSLKTPLSVLAYIFFYKFGDMDAVNRYFRPRKKYQPPPIHLLFELLRYYHNSIPNKQ